MFPPSCLLSLPEALTELLNSKLMSTLIEAVIGLIALINHLSGGTTFVGIWNRCWHWLRVTALFAGREKQNYIRVWKQQDPSVNICILSRRKSMEISERNWRACEEERHSLNSCDPWGEPQLLKFILSSVTQISVRNWYLLRRVPH